MNRTRNDIRTVLIEALLGAADGLRKGFEAVDEPRTAQASGGPGEPPLINGRAALSVVEAAKVLGIGRSAAYVLIQTGELRSINIGRRRLVPAKALLDFLEGTPTG